MAQPSDARDRSVVNDVLSGRALGSVALAALFCVVFVLVDQATTTISQSSFAGTPFRPEAALAVSLIVLYGVRAAPVVLIALVAAEWQVRGGTGHPASSAFAAAGMTLTYIGVGVALRRWTRWTQLEVSLTDLTRLVLIVMIGACLSASFYTSSLWMRDVTPPMGYAKMWLRVVVADTTGLMIFAPLLLQLVAGGLAEALAAPAAVRTALRDLLIFVAVVIAILSLVFVLKPFDEFRMFYLLFMPMIAVAMRWGLAGALVAMPIVQAGLIVALSMVLWRDATPFEFQMLLLMLSVTSLYLGTLADDRSRAARAAASNESKLREQRAALGEAQRIASTAELAAALAHDLNQPLSAISTYSRAARLLAERGETERVMLTTTLDHIERESSRAGDYVRRMRDFFRSGSLHLESVRVDELVGSAYVHIRDRLLREGITWSVSIDTPLPAVHVDTVQIGAILGNLLANACDALASAPAARQILVTATLIRDEDEPMVKVCVSDSGDGVTPAVRAQLFKPLATTKPHGMGLGLALSRSIAERQGGRLWFDAERQMTTFCLALPIVPLNEAKEPK